MHDALPDRGGSTLGVAQLTDPGGRGANQDALASAQFDEVACFVVSDGVGGHRGGEIASALVVKAVVDAFVREATFSPRALQSYIGNAILQVNGRKSRDARLESMSATVAAVLIDCRNRLALWAHMGDSRIYLLRQNKIIRVTKDHSLVQQLVDAGYCSADQLRSHPQRSILCAAVGVGEDCMAEVTETAAPMEEGDAFLVCTDGFWEWVTEPEMEQAAAASASAGEWLMAMRTIAERNGSHLSSSRDNYSAFTIRFGGVPSERQGTTEATRSNKT